MLRIDERGVPEELSAREKENPKLLLEKVFEQIQAKEPEIAKILHDSELKWRDTHHQWIKGFEEYLENTVHIDRGDPAKMELRLFKELKDLAHFQAEKAGRKKDGKFTQAYAQFYALETVYKIITDQETKEEGEKEKGVLEKKKSVLDSLPAEIRGKVNNLAVNVTATIIHISDQVMAALFGPKAGYETKKALMGLVGGIMPGVTKEILRRAEAERSKQQAANKNNNSSPSTPASTSSSAKTSVQPKSANTNNTASAGENSKVSEMRQTTKNTPPPTATELQIPQTETSDQTASTSSQATNTDIASTLETPSETPSLAQSTTSATDVPLEPITTMSQTPANTQQLTTSTPEANFTNASTISTSDSQHSTNLPTTVKTASPANKNSGVRNLAEAGAKKTVSSSSTIPLKKAVNE